VTDLSQQEEQGGSTLRGCIGAFLGALVGDLVWVGIMVLTTDYDWGQLTILLGILPGLTAAEGYRLLRGKRFMKRAIWTVRISLVLALPPAFVLLCFGLLLYYLSQQGLPLTGPAIMLCLQETFSRLFGDTGNWLMLALLAFLSLVFSSLGLRRLLKYVDPQWLRDPRYLASRNAGGATYNLLPAWPLPPAEVPETFLVGKTLRVDRETLTYLPGRKKERTFSVQQVAGVLLGPSNGENILYDEDRAMLAKFAWSRKNALVLGQYLLGHQIPFVDGDWAPLPQPGETPPLPPLRPSWSGRARSVWWWAGSTSSSSPGCWYFSFERNFPSSGSSWCCPWTAWGCGSSSPTTGGS